MTRLNLIFIYSTLALFAVIAAACTKEVGKLPPPPPILCDTINYTEDVEPIISKNCLGCHGVKPTMVPAIPLTSYADLVSEAEKGDLYKYVIQGSPYFMPKGSTSGLPQNEKDIISCWLQNGYKRN